jgi:tRNA modification GTPase
MQAVDTIVAMATPPGRGGIGIIRISGPKAFFIATQLTHKETIKPRQAYYQAFYAQEGELLDMGLLIYFKSPHSFTGEDVVEFQVHGSPVVLDQLLKECVSLGSRLAKPGEFSERAFLNDKIDLTQAEAIADLIDASSQTAAKLAVRSLQGDFAKTIHALTLQLMTLRLYVEAAIDFPEEEIDFLNDGKIASLLEAVLVSLECVQRSAAQGVLIREGGVVVIVGPPNAGKSTLMNALAGYDLAIVTEIPGTTRDLMREHVSIDDIPLQLIDTAGLRETSDVIEQEGIKRAWLAVERADCVLMVIDVAAEHDSYALSDAIRSKLPPSVPFIYVMNKIDQQHREASREEQTVYLSAKNKEGITLLKRMIKEAMGYQPTEGLFLARQRHMEALNTAHTYLVTGRAQLLLHRAGELLAEDLKAAHQALCEITGTFTSDDLLGEIFSSFCIGK